MAVGKPSSDAVLSAAIAAAVGVFAFLGALLVPLLADLSAPVRWSLFAASAIALPTWVYYYFVLGGGDEPPFSSWRREFESLRESPGGFNALYARYLTRALDGLDLFLGDAETDEVARLARASGTPPKVSQCWSALAYDKCLLLALIYPLLTMFAVWVASGQAGDAEEAIGLSESSPGDIGWRLLTAASGLFLAFSLWRLKRAEGWKIILWVSIFYVAVAVAVAVAGVGAVAAARALWRFRWRWRCRIRSRSLSRSRSHSRSHWRCPWLWRWRCRCHCR